MGFAYPRWAYGRRSPEPLEAALSRSFQLIKVVQLWRKPFGFVAQWHGSPPRTSASIRSSSAFGDSVESAYESGQQHGLLKRLDAEAGSLDGGADSDQRAGYAGN